MKKNLILLVLLALASPLAGFSQLVKYDVFEKIDGVEFSYRWVRENPVDIESPLSLSIKVKNKNSYPVNINFGLEYKWLNSVTGYSEMADFCLLPNDAAMGRISGLLYSIDDLTDEQKQSKDFTFNLYNAKINQIEKCNPLSN